MPALIEESGIIFGTHHKCLVILLNGPIIIKLWVPCNHLMLYCSSRSVFSFSINHLNVSNITLLSVLFLAPLSRYWNISACLWLACYQPLLLAWLELKKMCANFLLFHVPCMREGSPTVYDNMMEIHLQRNAWSNRARPPLQKSSANTLLETHKFRWCQRARAHWLHFQGALLRTPPDCPSDPIQYQTQSGHLPSRTGIAFFNCQMISLRKTSHNQSPLKRHKNHLTNFLLLNKKPQLTEIPRILQLFLLL